MESCTTHPSPHERVRRLPAPPPDLRPAELRGTGDNRSGDRPSLAIFTGKDNIYSEPEFSFGSDGKTWLHVGAHLVLGTTIAPLISWLVGCLIMFATKKLVTRGRDARAPGASVT